MTAYIINKYLQDWWLLNCTFKYILSHLNFLLSDVLTLLKSFVRTFWSFWIFHGRYYLDALSPVAPVAWTAASGPAQGFFTGPSWLPLELWLPHPPLLASRVQIAVLVCRQLYSNQSGGGTGLDGSAGWAALAAGRGVVFTGITDSSLTLLLASSAVSSPPTMLAISFMAATLVALEVRWTPSPAQMLVPSTVVRSCKGDSSGPKNSRIFKILASEVSSPAVVASERLFSDLEISLKNPDPGGLTHGWSRRSRRPGRTWVVGPLAVFWLPSCWRWFFQPISW